MGYVDNNDTTMTKYYYPRKALACYHCIVEQISVDSKSTREEILKNNQGLAEIYYTALGRERYGMYRVENAF